MKVDNTGLDQEAGADKVNDYEAVVELANRSKDPLSNESIKKIDELIKDMDKTDDPVFQVNCLQLVADLACSSQALAILEERQVPAKLITLLNESDPLIVPHALKFFYRIDPKYLETKYPQVLNKICDYCQSENKQMVDYAIDIIASIGRGGYSARKVLDNHQEFASKSLAKLGQLIISSDSLLKSRTLRCIFDLLELHDDDPKEESANLSEKFYHTIIEGENRMTTQVLALCRVPFMEIRINAMLIITAVAVHPWAQKELASHPNFVTWILDRSSETCKESKEAKFEILKTLVKSNTASRAFKGEDYLKMRADFKNGPFHVGIAEEMLMDDQAAG